MRILLFSFFAFFLFSNCKTYEASPHDFPKPVDTTSRPIELQEKKTFSPGGDIFASNQFDGARLNNFEKDGSTYRATIAPENSPINPSPYYAFKLWGETPQLITLELNYTESRHRYWPKISYNGKDWFELDKNSFELDADSVNAFLNLEVTPDTLWVAAQEVQNSTHVKKWCEEQAKHISTKLSSIGKSEMGKNLPLLDIYAGDKKGKDIIVILSRQHPPEVTGYFAMQAFVEEILSDHKLANDFRKKYRILVYPLMNPDGVDQGHWRHNAGGIDLNRDWAYYRQAENRQVANHIVRTAAENKSEVILGLDFHSTYYDVYYTNQEPNETINGFKDYWLVGIENALGEKPLEKPSNVGGPVSKNWFRLQFGAEGIVYEIGDDTPRDFIQKKGKISAVEMMELLIFK